WWVRVVEGLGGVVVVFMGCRSGGGRWGCSWQENWNKEQCFERGRDRGGSLEVMQD
nr:hypothetical protein [Tanacetum cinerariifolium]